MNTRQVNALKLGLYRIHWKSGGQSLAAVGMCANGAKWLAPINWVAPTTDAKWWVQVKSVEYLQVKSVEYLV